MSELIKRLEYEINRKDTGLSRDQMTLEDVEWALIEARSWRPGKYGSLAPFYQSVIVAALEEMQQRMKSNG